MSVPADSRPSGEDEVIRRVEKRIADAEPIETLIVDSDDFDRLIKKGTVDASFQGLTLAQGQPTTLATVKRNKAALSAETSPTLQSIKTPESKPALPLAQPFTRSLMGNSFTEPHISPQTHAATTHQKSFHDTPTSTTVRQTQTGVNSGLPDAQEDLTGIIIGFVVAGVTTAVICLVGLFFLCRHKRKKELKDKGEGETGHERRSGMFGKAKRSASQHSAESKKKLLARTLTREKTETSTSSIDEPWRPNDAVHHPPYQHIPRNLGSELTEQERTDRTNRAASPSSADTPLPDLPTRPPTMELRNSTLKHRPSLPIELRPFTHSAPPVVGLTRPKTAYGNNVSGRHSASATDRGVRRSSTNTHQNHVSMPNPRGRSYTLNNPHSPIVENHLAPPAPATDAASTRSISRSPKSDLSRRTSQSSQRYTIFPKSERRGSFESIVTTSARPHMLSLQIPGSRSWRAANSPRPGISRTLSYNNLREDPSGIPTVWTKGDSPRASPTRTRADSGLFYGPAMELNTFPSRSASKRAARMQLVMPESPVDGSIKSISTTDSSILDTFRRGSGPAIPPKSPLRGNSPVPSEKPESPPVTQPSSPCLTESNSSVNTSPHTPVKIRRRNTGFRPDRRPSQSPPPALPPLPPVPVANAAELEPQVSTAHNSTSSGSTTVGSQTLSFEGWGHISNTNRGSGRPHSYSTNTTLSLGPKERSQTRFSFFPIYENRVSNQTVASTEAKDASLDERKVATNSAEEAVNCFFQAIQGGSDTDLSSVGDVEDMGPQLARCVSITSTSGSCRTTIDFRPIADSLHSRVLSRSAMDMHLEEEYNTCTDIEDVTASPFLSHSDSTASDAASGWGRPRRLRNLTDSTITTEASTYSPTLSMLNFYSITARYSITAGPPSTRSSLAARRNSQIPHISIPQPQLYIHPNTQLDIANSDETNQSDQDNFSADAPRGGSLSSATSPVSFTTAASSDMSFSPPLDMNITAPVPMNIAIPIPTPQIYSSSQEDLSSMHMAVKRGGPYQVFNPGNSYGDISSLDVSTKPSMNNLTIQSSLRPSRLDMDTFDRSVSGGTVSTLDKSSFRDPDVDKSTSSPSGIIESSDEAASIIASSDGGEFDLEIGGERRRSRSLGASGTMRLKRKRSQFAKDDRGRSRERKLV
ncbi:hypothetical protein AA313_de0203819 [Arthrobotrys entomopaga]|nr:hypothetical protein AA313_de0203819 [Arthrobotrys entomopaga]